VRCNAGPERNVLSKRDSTPASLDERTTTVRTLLRLAPLATLAAIMIAGSPSASRAASCETPLKAHYRCSGTFDDGSSAEYCIHAYTVAPGDGAFIVDEDYNRYYCTCEARGKAPSVRFGASTGKFFCSGGDGVALIGKASGSKLTGQGYATMFAPGVRSSFTCRADDTCQ
jgi:hypothetical protein